MALFKCKMCGGDLAVSGDSQVAVCEYCGTQQTVPKGNDEGIQNLFNRANNLRIKCEFDKAEQIYERILQQDNSEAEAHWGLVLCKYGIEYVEDPKTFKRVPTCHRTSFEAIAASAEYLAAVEYANPLQKAIYEEEAKAIDGIQKNILNIVKNEKPFDVFICYKESDEFGKRTVDSTIANDIYHQLTQEGLKVFYAAITLEDKLGQEYEPYIFAALNSAKAMLVIGTKPEYFNAVWVKNEWSRYLKLMKTDRSRLLIPCFKDMDAYDLPEEFAHLQAQDMAKIGFINDVVRNLGKILKPKNEVSASPITGGGANTAVLLKRVFMFLEDMEWGDAKNYCEKVLDIDPENAQAYLGKLMADYRISTKEGLKNSTKPLDNSADYQKAIRFGTEEFANELKAYNEHVHAVRSEGYYADATQSMNAAKSEREFRNAAEKFEKILHYKDSNALRDACIQRADNILNESIYLEAKQYFAQNKISALEKSAQLFERIKNYKDSAELFEQCHKRIKYMKINDIYLSARRDMNSDSASRLEDGIAKFERIKDFKDSEKLIEVCRKRLKHTKGRGGFNTMLLVFSLVLIAILAISAVALVSEVDINGVASVFCTYIPALVLMICSIANAAKSKTASLVLWGITVAASFFPSLIVIVVMSVDSAANSGCTCILIAALIMIIAPLFARRPKKYKDK